MKFTRSELKLFSLIKRKGISFLKIKFLVDSGISSFSKWEMLFMFILGIILALFNYGLYSQNEIIPPYFAAFCRVCLSCVIGCRGSIQMKELFYLYKEHKHMFSFSTEEGIFMVINFIFKFSKIFVRTGGSAAAVGALAFLTFKIHDMEQTMTKTNHENDVVLKAKNAELAAKDAQIREYQRAGEYPKVKTPPLSSEAMDKLVKDILNNSKKK